MGTVGTGSREPWRIDQSRLVTGSGTFWLHIPVNPQEEKKTSSCIRKDHIYPENIVRLVRLMHFLTGCVNDNNDARSWLRRGQVISIVHQLCMGMHVISCCVVSISAFDQKNIEHVLSKSTCQFQLSVQMVF